MALQRFRVDVACLIRTVWRVQTTSLCRFLFIFDSAGLWHRHGEPFTVLLIYSEWIRCNPFTVAAMTAPDYARGFLDTIVFCGWRHGARRFDHFYVYGTAVASNTLLRRRMRTYRFFHFVL